MDVPQFQAETVDVRLVPQAGVQSIAYCECNNGQSSKLWTYFNFWKTPLTWSSKLCARSSVIVPVSQVDEQDGAAGGSNHVRCR